MRPNLTLSGNQVLWSEPWHRWSPYICMPWTYQSIMWHPLWRNPIAPRRGFIVAALKPSKYGPIFSAWFAGKIGGNHCKGLNAWVSLSAYQQILSCFSTSLCVLQPPGPPLLLALEIARLSGILLLLQSRCVYFMSPESSLVFGQVNPFMPVVPKIKCLTISVINNQ